MVCMGRVRDRSALAILCRMYSKYLHISCYITRARERACVCVFVCTWRRASARIACVCVCRERVCVCERERERETDRQTERENVCVCMYLKARELSAPKAEVGRCAFKVCETAEQRTTNCRHNNRRRSVVLALRLVPCGL